MDMLINWNWNYPFLYYY